MKRIILFVLIVFVFTITGIIFIYLNTPSKNSSTSSSNNYSSSSLTYNDVNLLSKGSINIIKLNNSEYELILYNNNIEPNSIEMVFQTSNQFISFVPDNIYDTVLLNNQKDNLFYISFGKLINLNRASTNKINDGGYILGRFKSKNLIISGDLLLLTDQSKYVDSQTPKEFNPYKVSLANLK